jgi:phosphatidylserine/phosphatidylglycerophosphate/cardiolipin synthase-like enzyme
MDRIVNDRKRFKNKQSNSMTNDRIRTRDGKPAAPAGLPSRPAPALEAVSSCVDDKPSPGVSCLLLIALRQCGSCRQSRASRARKCVCTRPGRLQLVLKGIAQRQHSIHLAAYVFTSKPVATALLEARRRGRGGGRGGRHAGNQRQYSATRFLANQQLPVRLNGKYAILHDKFMIIDQQHVQTGSFNYTAAAASKNAENVLIIWNAPDWPRAMNHNGSACGRKASRWRQPTLPAKRQPVPPGAESE